jgi:S1-C subfamily serine protease
MDRLEGGSRDVTIREISPRGGEAVEVPRNGVSVREVYTRDGPGVVSVDVASSESGPAGGSGFVLDEEGYIVTNQHVVDGAENVSIEFASGVREEAEIVGEDPSTDVAVVKVDAAEGLLEPLTLGDSSTVGVGEPVIAIGNPLDVGISVTTGIVSGIGRPIKAPNDYTIDDAVQTDAAINPGNSGGPLLDSRGTVIGVNAQIASESGGFEGVGFAVPIDTVKSVVEQLITSGEVVHGYIGVRMFSVGMGEVAAYTGLSREQLAGEYGLPGNGAIVSEVTPGSPAAEAGIEGGEDKEIEGISIPLGDVVTEIGGKSISSPDDLIEVVNSSEPGDGLILTVVTPGEEPRRVEVRVGVRPDDA